MKIYATLDEEAYFVNIVPLFKRYDCAVNGH